MPPNDKKNEGSAGGALKPPSGGAGSKNNPDPAVKDAAPSGAAAGAVPADKTDEGKAPKPKVDPKGPLPDSKTNTDSGAVKSACTKCGKMVCTGDCDKSASVDDAPIDGSFHLKLASIILETQEGRDFAEAQIARHHGAQAANDIVKAACLMEDKARELAEAEESGAIAAEEMWKSASAEERENIVKLASVRASGLAFYQTEHEKAAYDAGAAGAAQMIDDGSLGAGGDPGAAGGMPPGGDPAAGMPPGGDPSGGDPTGAGGGGMEEAIMAALDQMVQSGEITPEMAGQILQALQSGGAEGGAPGGAPGGEMPPGGPGGDAGGGMPPGGPGGPPPGAGGGGPPPGAEKKSEKKPEKKDDGDGDKDASAKSASNREAVLKFVAKAAKPA
jgi:hypothetical protein